MPRFVLFLAAGSAALAAGSALADELTLEPSPAVVCLSPRPEQRSAVVYPDTLLVRKLGGTVVVELQFLAPDRPPQMKVLEAPMDTSELVAAVSEHVKQLRVPCMQPGADPVRIKFQFAFDPFDGRQVFYTRPIDLKDEERRRLGKCLTHVDGMLRPHYPSALRRANVEGKVLVRLHFTGKDSAPRVESIASGDSGLMRAVYAYAAGLRLPCMAQEPLSWTTLYDFHFENGNRAVLNDTSLVNLLRNSKLPPGPVRFDLDGMQCPFDLRVTYRQPYLANAIGEVGSSVAARRPLMEWLEGIEFDNITTQFKIKVIGEKFNVTVPCGLVEL